MNARSGNGGSGLHNAVVLLLVIVMPVVVWLLTSPRCARCAKRRWEHFHGRYCDDGGRYRDA
jgi:endo-1,4-beta-D-glucanase Y